MLSRGKRIDMKKETFVTKAQLEEIVKDFPTPFHLYDENGIQVYKLK